MFAVAVTFQIKTNRIEDFVPLMIANAQTSRRTEVGCQQFDVCRDGETVFLYEIYDSRAAFDEHLASDHFKTFDAAVAEMIADKQVAVFDEVMR